MATSRAEIVILALEVLGRLQNGEVAAEDAEVVDKRIPYAIAELNNRDIIYLDDDNSYDNAVVGPFSDFLAAFSAPSFSVGEIAGLRLYDFRTQAERRLRLIASSASKDFVIRRDYF